MTPDDAAAQRDGRALGSPLRLQVRGSVPAGRVDRAWDCVRAEFGAVDVALSRWRPDSELVRLHAHAGNDSPVPVSARLRHALVLADRGRRMTGGRFDAAVHAALEALGERAAFAPEAVQPAAVAAPDGRTVTMAPPPEPLDLGGLGKGLALRWAMAAAVADLTAGPIPAGGAELLLECGGDVVAGAVPGTATSGEPWRAGIEDPADPDGEPVVVVGLWPGRALATSSVRVRHWAAPSGAPAHHLIDPRTGAPARTGLLAVTVMATDPAWAEIWTKSLFLAGRAAIAAEARARDLAAWWIAADGRLGMTPAARQATAWADEARLGA